MQTRGSARCFDSLTSLAALISAAFAPACALTNVGTLNSRRHANINKVGQERNTRYPGGKCSCHEDTVSLSLCFAHNTDIAEILPEIRSRGLCGISPMPINEYINGHVPFTSEIKGDTDYTILIELTPDIIALSRAAVYIWKRHIMYSAKLHLV